MVTVLCSPGAACWILDFATGSEALGSVAAGFPPGGVASRSAIRAIGSPPSGLSLKMATPAKATRNRPSSTASAWVMVKGNRNRRFARSVFCPSGVLRSSAVSAMNLPESAGADDTTAGQDRDAAGARPWPSPCKRQSQVPRRAIQGTTSKKGGPKAALFANSSLAMQDQFASLLVGLSIAALSPVAGAVALTLTPCSRSAAIFKALSSLASGGT